MFDQFNEMDDEEDFDDYYDRQERKNKDAGRKLLECEKADLARWEKQHEGEYVRYSGTGVPYHSMGRVGTDRNGVARKEPEGGTADAIRLITAVLISTFIIGLIIVLSL